MLIKLSILVLCHTIIAEARVLFDFENVEFSWDLFEDHNKNDEPERKEIIEYFRDNWDSIVDSNDNDELGYLSKFFDKSTKGRETVLKHMRTSRCEVINAKMPHEAPEAFDWRDKGVVTSVKNQGKCLSSWAYAAAGNVESLHAIKHKELLNLSAQQILDCDLESNGCSGGDLANAFTMLVKRAGMQTATDYPARNPPEKRRCVFNESQIAAKVIGCNVFRYNDEEDIKEVLYKVGPLAVRFDRYSLQEYTKGISTICSCGVLNTGALLVGYGTENGTDYWTLKTAWTTSFGEEGYFRVKRGVGCLCIGEEVYSAVIG